MKTKKSFPGLRFNSRKDKRVYCALCRMEVKGTGQHEERPEAAGNAVPAGHRRPFSDTGPQGECGSVRFTHPEMQEQALKRPSGTPVLIWTGEGRAFCQRCFCSMFWLLRLSPN